MNRFRPKIFKYVLLIFLVSIFIVILNIFVDKNIIVEKDFRSNIEIGGKFELIDINKDRLNNAENQLDIKVIKGNSCSLSILKQANISDSDLLIAVTAYETTNITVCALSKQLGCKRTIARISSEEYINENADVSFRKLGVDELISPQSLAADEIQQLLDQSAFTNSYEFEGGALTLIGTRLEDEVPFVGNTVKEAASIFSDVHFMPVAVQRKGKQTTIIPRGDTVFEVGDTVFFILPDGNGVPPVRCRLHQVASLLQRQDPPLI